MRKELDREGAFDRFEKKPDNTDMPLIDKKRQLLENMAEREDEPFLEYRIVDKPLTKAEALELGKYLTKKEVIELVQKKYPSIKTRLNMIELLIKLSEQGIVPITPVRFVNCSHCGNEIEYRNIQMIPFWELQEKSSYCDDCKKLIDELNKPETKQITL